MNNLRSIVSNVLGVSPSALTEDSSPQNITSWDSFNGLMIVSELESNFKIHFTVDEVISFKNFRDIKECLRKHGITEGLD